ncbi:hypothetical protein V491_02035 [Pseudogymnoascus sp. VKM F-3775]|nr:hypothetical protein V491_02035 [Pseudogymnoascus sp. VKM F-3775]
MPQFNRGQTVHYKPVGGPESHTAESTGIVRDVLTEPGMQADRNVNASPENPRYENNKIENTNTGKVTSIYETNIMGTV